MAIIRFDVGPHSFSKTVSAAHLARLNTACRSYFAMPASATDAQVATQLASWLWSQITGMVKQEEQKNAIKTAAEGVTDINLT